MREANVLLEAYRGDHNQRRPHSAHGQRTPHAFYAAWIEEQKAEKIDFNPAALIAGGTKTGGGHDHFLGPNAETYHLHVTAAVDIGPGARAQTLHREEDPFTFFPPPRPNLVVESMWAVTDFRADNCATLLVPGSHRWEAERVAEPHEVVSAEMPAGSLLYWLGGTLHAADALAPRLTAEVHWARKLTYDAPQACREGRRAPPADDPPNEAEDQSMLCCFIGSLILVALCSRIPILRGWVNRRREQAMRERAQAAAWRLHEGTTEKRPSSRLAA